MNLLCEIFAVLLLFMAVGCYAQNNYIIKDKDISVGIKINDEGIPSIGKIAYLPSGVNFITDNDSPVSLWSFTVKPDGKYTADEITVLPSMAEKVSVTAKNTSLEMLWKNVRTSEMKTGFDVTVTVSLKEGNSYWNINISENKDYGIWQVKFPCVSDIDVSEENTVMIPNYSGILSQGYNTNQSIEYPGVVCSNQFSTVTKKDATLYISPEDVKAEHKIFTFNTPAPGNMLFSITNNPDYMGEANHSYKQSYAFNFAVLKGDWFDAAKKFRKWGIASNFAPFSNGPIAERKDLPQWFKDNPVWISHHGLIDLHKENVIKTKEFLGVPCACHTYHWSTYTFDTHYPNYMPAQERFKQDIKDEQAKGIKVMPYTNGHLVDINQAPSYKEYGDIMLSFGPDEKPRVSEFQAEGANNVTCCPTSPYYDVYVDQVCQIMKEENIDALYIDQVGCVPAFTCFNKEHKHPVGGGSHWTDTYFKMINEVREKLNAIKGEPIVITTESSAEAYPFDAWLRCNEGSETLTDSPVNTVVYSGYVASFGDYYYGEEYTRQDSLPAINKTAVALSKGFQPGWGLGTGYEVNTYPNFGKYFKGVAQARYS
ncbi:MAG: hypothetical protein KBT47_09450 [Armatimonadetes bacterium]|nr:hypothetical protein [Candidatus Hippobium faecium]